MNPPTPFGAVDPVARVAANTPDAIALHCLTNDDKVTYGELDARVGRAAGWLVEQLGEPRGQCVAWLGRNSVDQVVGIFACYRVGAIAQPLNWRLPGIELKVLVEDAAPSLVIYETEFEEAALEALTAAPNAKVLRLTPSGGEFGQAIADAPQRTPVAVDENEPFILLYTSGSTGKPKGVVITRANAAWESYNFTHVGKVTAASGILCDAPMFHTVGLVAVLRTGIENGATVLITDRFLPDLTLKRISDPSLGITHYFAVPQIAQMLRDHPDYPQSDLTKLTALFTGGAPMPPVLIEQFTDDGVILCNGYGLSETGTVMGMPLDRDVIRSQLESSGVLAPAVELKVARPDGSEADIGEAGEVWLRGPGVTPGYWNQPEINAKTFADGWFRTGDVGLVNAEGFYVLIDRVKDMYITGGENVYPAEVEAAVVAMPGVSEVAIVGYPDAKWGESGCAFIVPAPGAILTAAEVLKFCDGRLARYKHPRLVRFVDSFIRTGSGKVKKDELRKLLVAERIEA